METTMTTHKIATREEWQAARAALLEREKEHTRMGDELARQRRELPWVPVEKEYTLQTADGPKTLAELFDGRSQLLIYHFMFGPSYEAGCPVNSSIADTFDSLIPHLKARDVTLIAVSGAPIEKLLAYRERMGWSFNWASSYESDFNTDLGFSSSLEQTREAIEPILDQLPPVAFRNAKDAGTDIYGYLTELFGFTAFTPRGRGRLPDLLDDGSRGRVPDALLRVPRPRAEGPRRGRGVAALDPPPRRVRQRVRASEVMSTQGHDIDQRLLLACAQAGDERAFRRLVEPYRHALEVHCYRMLGSAQDAEDLAQETLLRAWRALERFEPRAQFQTWLYRIATNACLDELERRPRRPKPVDPFPDRPSDDGRIADV